MSGLELSPLSAFSLPELVDWERRATSEIDGASLESLWSMDASGLPRAPLYTARDLPPGAPIGRRPARGWVRVESLAPAVPVPRAEEDAELWAFELDGPPPRGERPERWLLASHAELARAAAGSSLCGGYDPLGAAARHGSESPAALRAELALVPAALEARGRPLRIELGAYHAAGAQAVTELAYALATLAEYARAAGAAAERLARASILAFEVGRDIFDEIAKLRAARALWARFFGALGSARIAPAWIHATTSARALEVNEPETNVLRATTQGFAAVLGGADSLRVRPHDEATLAEPSAGARRLARNAQRILAEEALLGRIADAAGGSYLVERRSDELARAAWQRFLELERRGGMLAELADGRAHSELAGDWRAFTARVARREAHVLGVTLHVRASAVPRAAPAPESARARAIAPLPCVREGAAAACPEAVR